MQPFLIIFYQIFSACLRFYFFKLQVIEFFWIFPKPFRPQRCEIFFLASIRWTDFKKPQKEKLVTVNPLFWCQNKKKKKNFFTRRSANLKHFLSSRHSFRVWFLSARQLQKSWNTFPSVVVENLVIELAGVEYSFPSTLKLLFWKYNPIPQKHAGIIIAPTTFILITSLQSIFKKNCLRVDQRIWKPAEDLD